jgi:L-alanine-DL-glutamate epimerase-like enolase superfamily enzyme
MRIAQVTAHVLEADLSQPFAWSFSSTAKRSARLVEIVGEDGTTGWGECFGPAELNAALIGAFRPHLLGADALASERIWMELHGRFRDQGQKGLMITALSGTGGLCEAKKIADMAAAFGVRCVPHVWGTGVGLAAALQLIAVLADNPPRHTPLASMLEFDRSEHRFRQAVLTAPIEADAGMVAVPEAVGLGIAIDGGALERFRKTPDRC